jgi:hypothetical protein
VRWLSGRVLHVVTDLANRTGLDPNRPLRGTAEGELVVAGVARFERWMIEALGQSPAVTADDGRRRSAALERRVALEVLRAASLGLAKAELRDVIRTTRLFDNEFCAEDARTDVEALVVDAGEPEQLGELLESLLSLAARKEQGKLRFRPNRQRKQRGMFYTPRGVVNSVVAAAIRPWIDEAQPLPRVCDPSLGGGAFLLGVARALVDVRPATTGQSALRRAVVARLHGFDIEPLAIAVTEAALILWARGNREQAEVLGRQLRLGDALALSAEGPYDLVIGNPPWVAYAGRATQPLPEKRRAWLAKSYQAFHGYPTLQACFVELAARLAPTGRVALLVPSPIADLDGYRPLRRVLSRTHRVQAELVEYGQDAFEGVVQPCFGLIADADPNSSESDVAFALVERSGLSAQAARVEVPSCLARLAALDRFSADCFGEWGFQTTSEVTRSMLLRGDAPKAPYDYPLLEGRQVKEFVVGDPRLHLHPDREKLRRLHCRLRELDEYRRVEFVVRQTAKYTIAALHSGIPFRNSLLAGFGQRDHSAKVLVGLLNSTLLRAVHLASQRDARQKTFPQVKLAHLRALPAPPRIDRFTTEIERLVSTISGREPTPRERQKLDALVYTWYGIGSENAAVIDRFFEERAR